MNAKKLRWRIRELKVDPMCARTESGPLADRSHRRRGSPGRSRGGARRRWSSAVRFRFRERLPGEPLTALKRPLVSTPGWCRPQHWIPMAGRLAPEFRRPVLPLCCRGRCRQLRHRVRRFDRGSLRSNDSGPADVGTRRRPRYQIWDSHQLRA